MMLRTLSERTTVRRRQGRETREGGRAEGGATFVLADVLEGKREAGVFALDDADLAKRALADDTEQAEVVEVD